MVRDCVRTVRPCSELTHHLAKMVVTVVLDMSPSAYQNMAGGNPFVADVFGAIISAPNLCDKN
jgi:hypothetical protein